MLDFSKSKVVTFDFMLWAEYSNKNESFDVIMISASVKKRSIDISMFQGWKLNDLDNYIIFNAWFLVFTVDDSLMV